MNFESRQGRIQNQRFKSFSVISVVENDEIELKKMPAPAEKQGNQVGGKSKNDFYCKRKSPLARYFL
jgi:hypothetical protein